MKPVILAPEVLAKHPLPPVPDRTDKNGRGRVLIVAGGAENPGAALLCGRAAFRAGAGKVRLAASRDLAIHLGLALPETRVIPVACNSRGEPSPAAAADLAPFLEDCDALLIGPGMMDEDSAAELASRLAEQSSQPRVIVDAAALTGLRGCGLAAAAGRLVITPHFGEMAALQGKSKAEVEVDPAGFALQTAMGWGAIVALKDNQTHIATPEGRVWRHVEGLAALAVSGSGDVLAGVLVGLAARGASLDVATLWAVHAHAEAGRRVAARIGSLGLLPREVADEVANVLYG